MQKGGFAQIQHFQKRRKKAERTQRAVLIPGGGGREAILVFLSSPRPERVKNEAFNLRGKKERTRFAEKECE